MRIAIHLPDHETGLMYREIVSKELDIRCSDNINTGYPYLIYSDNTRSKIIRSILPMANIIVDTIPEFIAEIKKHEETIKNRRLCNKPNVL